MNPSYTPPTNAPVTTIPNAPQSTGSQPNFLERMLPTAGGILGGIVGLPGDFLGGAGSIAGASAGDALGKMAENYFTHQNLGSGVGGAAVQGGVGQAGGALLGSFLKGTGGLLSGISAKTASDAADAAAKATAEKEGQQALVNAQSKATADQAISEANTAAATQKQDYINKLNQAYSEQVNNEKLAQQSATKNNYGAIDPKVQRAWNLGGNQNFLEKAGYDSTDPYQMQKAAQSGLDMNNKLDQALKNVTIDTSGTENPAYKLAQEGKLDSPQGSALMRAYSNAKVPVDANGNIPANLPASSVRQLTQSLGSEIGDLDQQIAQAEASPTGQVNATMLKDARSQLGSVRNDLIDRLNKSPEVSSAVKNTVVSPDEQTQWASTYGDQIAKNNANAINGAQKYTDIAGELQRYAQMGKASKVAIDDIEKVTGTPRAAARVAGGAEIGKPQPRLPVKGAAIPEAPTDNPYANLKSDMTKPPKAEPEPTETSKTNAEHLGEGLVHATTGNKPAAIKSLLGLIGQNKGPVAGKLGDLLTRTGQIAPAAAQVVSNIPGDITSQGGGMTPTASTMPGGAMPGTTQPGQATSPIDQLVQELISQVQNAQANPLLPTSPTAISSGVSALDTLTPALQKSAIAQQQLGGLQTQLGASGGTGGIGGNGIMDALLARIPGTPQYAAWEASKQLTSTLGLSPGLGVNFMQNPQTSGNQIATLQNIISSMGGNGLLSNVPTQ